MEVCPLAKFGPCPQCGTEMNIIGGSKKAICANCGHKESCCY